MASIASFAETFLQLTDTPAAFIGGQEFIRENAGGTAIEQFDLFGSANTWSADQTHSANILASGTTREIGSQVTPFAAIRSRFGVLFGGDQSVITEPGSPDGGLLAGSIAGSGTNAVSHSGNYPPVATMANCVAQTAQSFCTIENQGGGSVVLGSAYTYGGTAAHTATIRCNNNSFASFTGGYSFCASGTLSSALIQNSGSGAFIWAYLASRQGGTLEASTSNAANGAFVQGDVRGTNANTKRLRAQSAGQFIQGSIDASGTSDIIGGTSSAGAFVQGAVTGTGGFVEGLAVGATAIGRAEAARRITASGSGSFASGDTLSGGNIEATAQNSFQWGVGTNAEADSLGVGTDMRLMGAGIAGVPRDGDMWLGAGIWTARSNGFNVTFDRPSITGSRGANAALASLLTALAASNLVVDNTIV